MPNDDDLSRIGVSLPTNLLGEFDKIIYCRGYTSRSEGIRDAIRVYNISNQWLSNSDDDRKGVITMVYDCSDINLITAISDIGYEHKHIINASLQTRITNNKRLEIFLVQGSSMQLKTLAEILTAQRGIGIVKITTTSLKADPDITQGTLNVSW